MTKEPNPFVINTVDEAKKIRQELWKIEEALNSFPAALLNLTDELDETKNSIRTIEQSLDLIVKKEEINLKNWHAEAKMMLKIAGESESGKVISEEYLELLMLKIQNSRSIINS